MIDKLDMDGENYLILLAFDTYDVPHYGKDGSMDDAGEVYKYMLCAVCPVKGGKSELGYAPEEKRFHSATAGQIVAAPELGFLFPAFDDRAANLYNALFYTRDSKADHADFIDAVFRTEVPMPAGRQRERFDGLLSRRAGAGLPLRPGAVRPRAALRADRPAQGEQGPGAADRHSRGNGRYSGKQRRHRRGAGALSAAAVRTPSAPTPR